MILSALFYHSFIFLGGLSFLLLLSSDLFFLFFSFSTINPLNQSSTHPSFICSLFPFRYILSFSFFGFFIFSFYSTESDTASVSFFACRVPIVNVCAHVCVFGSKCVTSTYLPGNNQTLSQYTDTFTLSQWLPNLYLNMALILHKSPLHKDFIFKLKLNSILLCLAKISSFHQFCSP